MASDQAVCCIWTRKQGIVKIAPIIRYLGGSRNWTLSSSERTNIHKI